MLISTPESNSGLGRDKAPTRLAYVRHRLNWRHVVHPAGNSLAHRSSRCPRMAGREEISSKLSWDMYDASGPNLGPGCSVGGVPRVTESSRRQTRPAESRPRMQSTWPYWIMGRTSRQLQAPTPPIKASFLRDDSAVPGRSMPTALTIVMHGGEKDASHPGSICTPSHVLIGRVPGFVNSSTFSSAHSFSGTVAEHIEDG